MNRTLQSEVVLCSAYPGLSQP